MLRFPELHLHQTKHHGLFPHCYSIQQKLDLKFPQYRLPQSTLHLLFFSIALCSAEIAPAISAASFTSSGAALAVSAAAMPAVNNCTLHLCHGAACCGSCACNFRSALNYSVFYFALPSMRFNASTARSWVLRALDGRMPSCFPICV
jgi:hypothetical protein